MIRLTRIIHGAAKQLAKISGNNAVLEVQPKILCTGFQIQVSGFKSHLSIDKIYPNSDPDFLNHKEKNTSETNIEEFTGYIPIEKLQIKNSRSSGPGGQNVNKVNSKVEVRFHLDSATWIPEAVKARLAENEQGRITKDGYFVVRSETTRKQLLNQADCLEKIRHFVFKAAAVPKGISKEDLKIKEERMAKAKKGILREKREKSMRRQARRVDMSSPGF